MRILIVEDTDERIVQFKQRLIGCDVIVEKTSKGAIKQLEENDPFDIICLDHDLTSVYEKSGEGTGYEVAEWIANHPEKQATKRIFIHSLNNVGASNMMLRLGDADIRAAYIPFLWTKIEIKRAEGITNE